MRTILATTLLFSVATSAFAAKEMPAVTSLAGKSITLRYQAAHETRCTTKTYTKKPGDFFGDTKTEPLKIEIYKDSEAGLKLAFGAEAGTEYFKYIISLNDQGTEVTTEKADFQTNTKVSDSQKTEINRMQYGIAKIFDHAAKYGVIGKQLTEGTTLPFNQFCTAMFGTPKSSNGGIRVIGRSTIKGRDSLILSGEGSFVCDIYSIPLDMTYKGWDAYDIESGLPAGSYTEGTLKTNDGEVRMTEEKECIVTGGTPGNAPLPQSQPSVEQRLRQLRALYENGLITKEQHDTKQADIINSL